MRHGRADRQKIVLDRPLQLPLGGDKAAPGRIPGLIREDGAVRIERPHAHPVRVKRRQDVIGEDNVLRRIEGNGRTACQRQRAGGFQRGNVPVCCVRVQRFRLEAQQAQHHGLGRRVPCPGQRERALQLHFDPRGRAGGTGEVRHEPVRDPDRADRV